MREVREVNKEYEKIPIQCQICDFFLEDDEFIKKYKTKFVCTYDNGIDPVFSNSCEEFVIGKWHLVEFLKRLSSEKSEWIGYYKKMWVMLKI